MDAGAVDDGYGATRRGNVDGEGNLNGVGRVWGG